MAEEADQQTRLRSISDLFAYQVSLKLVRNYCGSILFEFEIFLMAIKKILTNEAGQRIGHLNHQVHLNRFIITGIIA